MNRVEAAHIGKQLTDEARSIGLPKIPIFQFPPTLARGHRAVRRTPNGEIYAIAVLITGRADPDIVQDMVDGILVANRSVDAVAAEPAMLVAAAEILTHHQQRERNQK